ncbi:MAG: SDR family NAD(P)-dependent oxidoreductase [Hyphomicrobium denitrificans]|nr:SDR family NAD(P)-dependent oxidoreductase [Hyphomicrobium denitrificans]
MSTIKRTALVTGGNRGLGAAIARALHDAGHTVIITHTPGNNKAVAWLAAQADQGYGFAGYGVDVSDFRSTQNLAQQIHLDGRQIDILVNNAGITRDASLRKLDKADWDVVLGADATYRGFQFSSGLGLARNEINVRYAGERGKLDLSGAYMARAHEHVDTTLVVDHAVPNCESRELFKGVLDDHGRGVFQGKIIVRPDAQKTDGKQMAQALMLSEDAEFDSKPELEIFADDVVCGHGTTSAELDADLLFYCRSRGIPEAEARALMIESFIGEAIDKVENPELHTALMAFAVNWLSNAARG